MKVRDIMTADVHIVGPDTPLKDAAAMMRDRNTGFLPVGDVTQVVGTLTDRDITIRSAAAGRDPNKATVRDAMGDKVVSCREDDPVETATDLMARHQVRRLCVLNAEQRLVGVLSLGDVATRTHDLMHTGEAVTGISRKTAAPASAA